MGINSYTVVNSLAAAVAKQYVVAGPVALQTGVAIPIIGAPTLATQLEIYGYVSIGSNTIPVANAGSFWVSSDSTGLRTTDQILAGGKIVYRPPGGTSFDLAGIRVLGTTGDNVYIKYLS